MPLWKHTSNGGGAIRETRIHEPEEKTIWSKADTGESVHGQAVAQARKRELLKPLNDGLFGDAQTYVLAESVE